jgi:hypothetical protein
MISAPRFIAAANPTSRQVENLSRTSSRAELAAQLIEAHAKLQLAHRNGDAPAIATLVRHGSFEVRLVLALQSVSEGATLFWMELFDHDRQLSIDSVGNLALGDAVVAAEDLIARATRLSGNPHSWRRLT